MKIAKSTWALGLSCLLVASLAQAQTNPYEKGPYPTSSSLNATSGAFAVSTTTVSSSVSGFGGGTIYYPTTAGSYGVIAICPGYTASQSTIAWIGRRLATNGFVVITIDTDSVYDQPASRATQLRAALNYVVNSASSTVRSRVDGSRRGVAGHSMGGGGTLIASQNDSSLKVGIPMTPWNSSTNFSGVRVPTIIFGADGDTIASVTSHARPFYASIPSTTKKAYAELNGASHFTPNSTDERIGRYSVAFAKRFIDNDTRYQSFLCGSDHSSYATSSRFDRYQSTCPY